MNNEKYAVYERNPAHGPTKNGMILGPFNSKEEAQSNGEKYGYTGDNYYVNSVNNEKMNQIIDEAYKNYEKKTSQLESFVVKSIAGNRDEVNELLKNNSTILTQEEFINKCKTDSEFSETWGLKIEERELNHDERFDIYKKVSGRDLQSHISGINFKQFHFDESNIPTKLITVTYNNETIEIYE